MSEDFEIFDGKTFKGLCKDIYDRSEQKKDNLELLIGELRPLVKNIDDAMQVVPKIQGYLDISVKNDEMLTKLAAIVQRLQTIKIEKGNNEVLTEDEREALWQEVKNVAKESTEPIPEMSGSIEQQ